jgi:hypothetical protein
MKEKHTAFAFLWIVISVPATYAYNYVMFLIARNYKSSEWVHCLCSIFPLRLLVRALPLLTGMRLLRNIKVIWCISTVQFLRGERRKKLVKLYLYFNYILRQSCYYVTEAICNRTAAALKSCSSVMASAQNWALLHVSTLWHVDPLLSNDRETSNYTAAIAK